MAITERFALVEVRVKASVAEDGSFVPGGYEKFGMLHLEREDGTEAAPPQATVLAVDGSDRDVIALCGGGGALALQAQVKANNATFEELRARVKAAETERDDAKTAQAAAEKKFADVAKAVSTIAQG